MKNHEPAAAWINWALSVFRMTPAQARAVPFPPAIYGSEPPHFPVGQRGNTRNIEGMSVAARLMFFFLFGTAADLLAARREMLDLLAAELLAHWGIEVRAPAPHSFFYYRWMVVARMAALMINDAELLAATRAHWSAELALLRFCSTPQGGVWSPCQRAVGSPDHGEASWVLLFLEGKHPAVRAVTAEQLGLEHLGFGWTVDAPVPRLATPILRQDWPDGSTTMAFDPAQLPAFNETPVMWTRVDAAGVKTFGREGAAPAAAGAAAARVEGGTWRGQLPAQPANPPVGPGVDPPASPPAAGHAATPTPAARPPLSPAEREVIAAGVERLKLAHSQTGLQAQVAARLRRGPLSHEEAQGLAEQVSSFSIGLGQAQANSWRALIAKLQGG